MRKTEYARPRTWKKIIRFSLDVLAAILILCAVLCTFSSRFLLNTEAYKSVVITEEFDSAVIKSIEESIEASSSIVEIPSEVVLEAVDRNRLIAYCHEYTLSFIDAAIENKEFAPEPFQSDKLKDAIFKQMEEYSEVAVVTEEEANAVYEYTLENIQQTLTYIPKLILNAMPSAARILSALAITQKLEAVFYALAAVVIVSNFLFGKNGHLLDVFFGTSAAVWVALCTVEIPLLMVTLYNIPSRLALSKTTFYYLVKGVFDMLFARSALVFGIALAIATAALVIAVILITKKRKQQTREDKTERFYRVHFEKEE
ncbi:MAG: hypothetical protein IKB86_04055 [Clostridia bacterium]|nr:hypothetical protein [Clostridia bacterium]